MIYHLFMKELREKRLALVSGLLWVFAPLYFWADYVNVDLPFLIEVPLQAAAMIGPAATVLLLACAPFFVERRNGTWHYLQSLPVSKRQIVFTKWVVPIGLGIFFMVLSSAIAWYPITHLDAGMSGISLLPWICLHAAAVALLISVLLLLDTMDWGEWLGLRAIVSFGFIISFLVFMEKNNSSFSWGTIGICAVISILLTIAAVVAAPLLAGESLLPRWGSKEQVISRRFSRDGAWLWLLWRQMRFIVVLLLLPVPFLLMVRVIAAASQAASPTDLLRLVLGSERSLPIAGLMYICAAMAGALLPIVENQSNAQSFRGSVPLPRPHAQRIRLAFAIGVLVLIFAPACLLLVYRANLADSLRDVIPGIISLFCPDDLHMLGDVDSIYLRKRPLVRGCQIYHVWIRDNRFSVRYQSFDWRECSRRDDCYSRDHRYSCRSMVRVAND